MLNKKIFMLLGATALSFTAVACSGSNSSPAAPVVSETSAEKAASSATEYATNKVISSGIFDGRSDHITTGKVTVQITASGYQLVFANDFSLDGAPDPIVAVGNGETYLASNKLSVLKNKTGAQTYSLPANIKPGEFTEVFVWCEKFNVPLGVAKLSAR